jgi:putative addiction module component (TIGR02574 family)
MTSTQLEAVARLALQLQEDDRHWLAERLWWSRQAHEDLDSTWDVALVRRPERRKPNGNRRGRDECAPTAVSDGTSAERPSALNEGAGQISLRTITDAALMLACAEREASARRLWASIDDPTEVAAAWAAEIERRVDEMEAGKVEWVSSDDVFAHLRAVTKNSGAR